MPDSTNTILIGDNTKIWVNQPLADPLLAGLMARHSAGGEFRPGVSAALLIVHRKVFP